MKKKISFLILLFIVVAVFLNNSSLLVQSQDGEAVLLAHRGVHQNYSKDGIDNKTCTASIIYKPTHDFLENTIPSIRAAFDAGADIVEIDIHPTTDGHFAVFHDWMINCRTNGIGITRGHSLKYLKTLDVGYGYTFDGGETFPLRGKGVGLLPSLKDVLTAFPDKKFLINIKSNDDQEADLLVKALKRIPKIQPENLMVYGGEDPTKRFLTLMPNMRGFTKKGTVYCLLQYELMGWSGFVPEACKRTALVIPINYSHWLWGWPHKFVARMKSVKTDVFVTGPLNKSGSIRGIDTLKQMQQLPEGYSGGIWTNRIEVIGKGTGR